DPCHRALPSVSGPLEPEHATYRVAVAAGDFGRPSEPACAGGGLLLEDVVAEGLASEDLAGARHLEALGCAPMRLHLRHVTSPASPAGPRRGWPPVRVRRPWST